MEDWEKPIDQILSERGATHGNYLEQAKTAQQLFQIVRQTPNWNSMMLDQRDAIESILKKISRIGHGQPNKADHWMDIIGYAYLIFRRLIKK